MMNPTAAILIAERQSAAHLEKAAIAYAAAVTHQARVDLASTLVANDVPAGATVLLLPFDDEPNPDGTFDVAFAEAYDADGYPLDDIHLSSSEALAAGLSEGVTAWDDFMVEDDWTLIVDRVYAWLDKVANTGPEAHA